VNFAKKWLSEAKLRVKNISNLEICSEASLRLAIFSEIKVNN